MPVYEAGQARLTIVPDAREFRTKLEADLKRQNVEYAVKITADLARARADLDKFRAEQEAKRVHLRAEVDRDHLRKSFDSVKHDFEDLGASLNKALKIETAAVGIDLLPALATGLASVAQALQQLGQAGLAVPGILAGVGASVGTLVLGLGGIKDAWTAITAEANQSGADQARTAQQAIAATNSLRNAKVDELNAQKDLADAYRDARNSLEDLNIQQRGGVLSEREAILEAQKARRDLATGRYKDALDYQSAQLRVEEADQRVVEARQHNLELNDKITDSNAKGITGADNVVAANERLTRSHQAVAAAAASVADLGAGGAADKAAEAMAKLAPNARQFVQTMLELKPAFLDLRNSDADKLFAGLGASLKTLAAADLPTLKSGISGIATALNQDIKQLFGALGSRSTTGLLDHILGNTADADARIKSAINPLVHAFGELAAVGSNSLPRLADALGAVSERFDHFISAAVEDGRLNKWINEGLTGFTHLGDIVINLARSFGAVSKALGGEGLLADFDKVTKKLADFLNSAKGQQEMTRFFQEGREEFHKWEPVIHNLARMLPALFQVAKDQADQFLQVAKPITQFLADNPKLVRSAIDEFLVFETTVVPIYKVGKAISTVNDAVKALRLAMEAIGPAAKAAATVVETAAVAEVAAEERVSVAALEADAAMSGGGAGPTRLGKLGRILGKSAGPLALGFLGLEGIQYAAESLSGHAQVNPFAGPNPTQGIQSPVPPTGNTSLLAPPGATPDWDATAQGESNGKWDTNTGNGYFGGLQFSQSSWVLAGGLKYEARADLATPEQQKAVANTLLAIQGPGAWPNTFKWKFGAATPPAGTDFNPPTDLPGSAAGGPTPDGHGPGPTGGFPIEAHGHEYMISAYGRSKMPDSFWHAANQGKLPTGNVNSGGDVDPWNLNGPGWLTPQVPDWWHGDAPRKAWHAAPYSPHSPNIIDPMPGFTPKGMPGFEGGGDVKNVGDDAAPGPGGVPGAAPNQALLGPQSVAPNPTTPGGGIFNQVLGGIASGAGGVIGNIVNFAQAGIAAGQAQAAGGTSGGGLSSMASVPGIWGLIGAGAIRDPQAQGAALQAWGGQTANWLGQFGAKTATSALNIGLGGVLGAAGLDQSILSPNNIYNQALQKTAGFYLGDQSPLRGLMGSGAPDAGTVGSQTITLGDGSKIQIPTYGTATGAASGAASGGVTTTAGGILVPKQWAGVDAIATQFGLTAGSRFRDPNGPAVAGVPANQSYHGSGRATDYNGTPQQRLAFANFMAANYGPQLKELIYSAPGFNSTIKDGQVVGPFGAFYTLAQAGDHTDHVHIAFAKGGPVPMLYDDGGVLNTGLTLVSNQSGQKESVINAQQTQAVQNLAQQLSAPPTPPTGPTAQHLQPPTGAAPITPTPSQAAPAAASPEAPQQAQAGAAILPSLAAPSIAPTPSTLDHNLKAIDTGIDAGAKAIGQALSTAIGIAGGAAGGFGGGAIGAIGPYVAGLVQEGGKVAKDVVNIGSSFLVGDVPGSTGTQSLAYGARLRAPQNVPNVSVSPNVTNWNISGNYELQGAMAAAELKQAQDSQSYMAHHPRTP